LQKTGSAQETQRKSHEVFQINMSAQGGKSEIAGSVQFAMHAHAIHEI